METGTGLSMRVWCVILLDPYCVHLALFSYIILADVLLDPYSVHLALYSYIILTDVLREQLYEVPTVCLMLELIEPIM